MPSEGCNLPGSGTNTGQKRKRQRYTRDKIQRWSHERYLSVVKVIPRDRRPSGKQIANTGLRRGFVERNYRLAVTNRDRHTCAFVATTIRRSFETYWVLNNCRPPGSVTRGASGPSRPSNFLVGSSCKRKNLNPTRRGF